MMINELTGQVSSSTIVDYKVVVHTKQQGQSGYTSTLYEGVNPHLNQNCGCNNCAVASFVISHNANAHTPHTTQPSYKKLIGGIADVW